MFHGESPHVRLLHAWLENAARSRAPALIRAETGLGKGRLARAVHDLSDLGAQPLVEVDCELPEFRDGHADLRRLAPPRGTLYLRNVERLGSSGQATLGRLLDRSEADSACPRVIASSRADLATHVAREGFSAPVYYRLRVLAVELVPLRYRPEDIQHLVRWWLDEHEPSAILTADALRRLEFRPWPGNVRELFAALTRATARFQGNPLNADDFSQDGMVREAANVSLSSALVDAERSAIRAALAQTNGARQEAAQLLGISRKGLWERMRRLDISWEP